ncbi:MAG: hypothetical protein OXP75_11275, partial [Rhodospirillales bacterium]|nr:hypothetical protein [Rhodospirillales bacterium]
IVRNNPGNPWSDDLRNNTAVGGVPESKRQLYARGEFPGLVHADTTLEEHEKHQSEPGQNNAQDGRILGQ